MGQQRADLPGSRGTGSRPVLQSAWPGARLVKASPGGQQSSSSRTISSSGCHLSSSGNTLARRSRLRAESSSTARCAAKIGLTGALFLHSACVVRIPSCVSTLGSRQWTSWSGTQGPAGYGGYCPSSWTATLRTLLAAEGVQAPQDWFGHDVRRGAAADVFATSGTDAVLLRGGWRSLAATRPYVPGDEVSAGLLAQGLADDSTPEN